MARAESSNVGLLAPKQSGIDFCIPSLNNMTASVSNLPSTWDFRL